MTNKQTPGQDVQSPAMTNEKNISYLEKQLGFLGFSDKTKEILKDTLKNQKEDTFSMTATEHYAIPGSVKDDPATRSNTQYEMAFSKGKGENGYYFLNHYTASDNGKQLRIYINNDRKNITAKEAFNLLHERSVYKRGLMTKDGKSYDAWIRFDFSKMNEKNQPEIHRYTDNYGYDISSGLKKLPLKENAGEDKHRQLIASLEKGNLQPVTAVTNGKEKQIFMEANPQYKNFNLYELNKQNKLVPLKTDMLLNNTQAENQKSEKEEKRPGRKI